IVEVHGDPRTFTRLYGSPARKLLSPLADSVSNRALRRADATRALSRFTSSLVERARGAPATACFPTYSDLDAFASTPPRPVPEAFARGRGAVATDAGGIPDIVTDGHDGLLVSPGDVAALVNALERVLDDDALAARLGAAARETYARWHQTPADFAQAYAGLV